MTSGSARGSQIELTSTRRLEHHDPAETLRCVRDSVGEIPADLVERLESWRLLCDERREGRAVLQPHPARSGPHPMAAVGVEVDDALILGQCVPACLDETRQEARLAASALRAEHKRRAVDADGRCVKHQRSAFRWAISGKAMFASASRTTWRSRCFAATLTRFRR